MAVAGAAVVCCQLHALSFSVLDYSRNAGVRPGESIIISGNFSRSDYSPGLRRNGLGACFGERAGDCGLFGGSSAPRGHQLLGLDSNFGSKRISRSHGASGRTTVSKAVDFWGKRERETRDGIIAQAAQCIDVIDGEAKESRDLKENIFDVEDPRSHGFPRLGVCDVNQAWELIRQDVLYLDWRARHDVYAIKTAHDKVVEVLNPLAREQNSVQTMRKQLAQLQNELARAHSQVHLSESRVEHSLQKLSEMEAIINDTLLLKSTPERKEAQVTEESSVLASDNKIAVKDVLSERHQAKGLDVSGPVGAYPVWLKNFWYPVAFSNAMATDTLVPFESFEEPWVLFRDGDGRPGCVRDECAHRACPLSLGTVHDGRIKCPYHGWEYSTSGKCEKMPSTRHLSASVRSLPCIEQDGMVWIWPGDATPTTILPSLNPPSKYTIHAEVVIIGHAALAQLILELPVEHGLLMENLLDLAHAPFTHTSTFAKGWSVPSMVRFKTPATALRGSWDPYPIDMEFQPPCMVLSTIGLVKPGQLDGSSTVECSKHLHQLHVCMPSTRGKTRLLYRMALDFAQWAKYVPFIQKLWENLANQVLSEDLRLVEGQQDRMSRGANVWRTPVAYDKLGLRYRRWRIAVEAGETNLPFSSTH